MTLLLLSFAIGLLILILIVVAVVTVTICNRMRKQIKNLTRYTLLFVKYYAV